MYKDIDYWPHRAWEPPFVGLVTPTFGVAEGIVAAFASLKDFVVRECESWSRRRLMARTIAELHGGKLVVESSRGGINTFALSLPSRAD